jgi:hypothetical protein
MRISDTDPDTHKPMSLARHKFILESNWKIEKFETTPRKRPWHNLAPPQNPRTGNYAQSVLFSNSAPHFISLGGELLLFTKSLSLFGEFVKAIRRWGGYWRFDGVTVRRCPISQDVNVGFGIE